MEDGDQGEVVVPGRLLNRGGRGTARLVHRVPARLQAGLDRAAQSVWARRLATGHWAGSIGHDLAAAVHYLLLSRILGQNPSAEDRAIADTIRQRQLPQGAWSFDAGGAFDLSLSVRCYLALKITGEDPASPSMIQARDAILMHGGADRANGVTRILLARLGQTPYSTCPAIPPEILFLPPRAPLSLFRVPLPSRVLLVALSLVWSSREVLDLPAEHGISELMVRDPKYWHPCAVGRDDSSGKWPPTAWLVRSAERCASFCERHRFHPLRTGAIILAQKWLRERTIIENECVSSMTIAFWTCLALAKQDPDSSSAAMHACLRTVDRLVLRSAPKLAEMPTVGPTKEVEQTKETGLFVQVQPWQTAMPDTARAIRCLAHQGLQLSDGRVRRSIDWLLNGEITKPLAPPRSHRHDTGGWCLLQPRSGEPDVETTAEVLLALRALFATQPSPPSPSEDSMVAMVQANSADLARLQVAVLDRAAAACRRGRRWLLAMQNQDGGWGRFERYGRRSWLQYSAWSGSFPTRDPSTPEVTGAVLEALGRWELRCGRAAIDRAVDFLAKSQHKDGFWNGDWTVSPMYGTWRAVEGLVAVGRPPVDPMLQAAVRWILSRQQEDGSWRSDGNSTSDTSESASAGPSSATQTAWGLMSLMAAGQGSCNEVRRGFDYLLQSQQADGGWIPSADLRVRALGLSRCQNDFDAVCYPYLALARWADSPTGRRPETGG